MADEKATAVDLLGDPWQEPKDPRGRKRHKRLRQVAESVAVLRGSGLSVEEIALRVGLSEPTLRKYYFRELQDGATLARAVLNEAMWKRALAGVVGAARYMREEFERGEVAVPVSRRPAAAATTPALTEAADTDSDDDAPTPTPQRAGKLGKKEAANRDAQTAHGGTGWEGLLKH